MLHYSVNQSNVFTVLDNLVIESSPTLLMPFWFVTTVKILILISKTNALSKWVCVSVWQYSLQLAAGIQLVTVPP